MKLLYRLAPLFLSVLLIGCATNPAQSNQAQSGSAFAPAGADFTVNMPGKAQEKTFPNGNHVFSTTNGDTAYLASYANLGRDRHLTAAQIDRLFERIVHGLGSKAGKVLSSKTISMDGHSARELRLQLKEGHFMRMRLTLVGARMFQVGVVTKGQRLDKPEITRFLDSFHITRH